jgi:hypothetical protein
MEEPSKYKELRLKDYPILKESEDVFGELSGLPPKIDIDLSIDLRPRANLVSKNPYKMITPKLKELQMQLE